MLYWVTAKRYYVVQISFSPTLTKVGCFSQELLCCSVDGTFCRLHSIIIKGERILKVMIVRFFAIVRGRNLKDVHKGRPVRATVIHHTPS